MDTRFKIEGEIIRRYRRFNAVGTQLTVRLLPPPRVEEEENPVSHFLASMNDMFQHALRGVSDRDMVGITIQNEVNQNDKAIGISFRLMTSYLEMLSGACLRKLPSRILDLML